MLTKTVLVLSIFIQIAYGAKIGDKKVRSSADDAQQALKELDDLGGSIVGVIYDQADQYKSTLVLQLEDEGDTVTAEIKTKLNDVLERISEMSKNANGIGVEVTKCTSKATNNLDAFRTDIETRLATCLDDTNQAGLDVINQSFKEVLDIHSNLLGCAGRTLNMCTSTENTESCNDFAIEVINSAKDRLPTELGLLQVNLANKIESLRLPCSDLIWNELTIYPQIVLDYAEKCITYSTKSTLGSSC